MAALPCRNCGTPPGAGEFCPGCGQRNRHALLRGRELFEDVFEQVVEWRLPWPRTIVDLLWRPGAVALDYVEGRRARYVNPVKYCFIVVAIAWAMLGSGRAADPYLVDLPANALALLSIPFQVGLLRLSFWRSSRTPTEIAVLCLYVTAQFIVLFVAVDALFQQLERFGLVSGASTFLVGAPIIGLVIANSVYALRTFFATSIYRAVAVSLVSILSTVWLLSELDNLLVRGELTFIAKYVLSGGG